MGSLVAALPRQVISLTKVSPLAICFLPFGTIVEQIVLHFNNALSVFSLDGDSPHV